MYYINYKNREIYKMEEDIIYRVIIRKENDQPILFRDRLTDRDFLTSQMYLDKTDSLNTIKGYLLMDIRCAKDLAKDKFAGMTDKAGVDYYKGHLRTVAARTISYQGEIAAYLHDILEDTDYSYQDLADKFGRQTARAVKTLTKPAGIDYQAYIKTITNPISREVKISDLSHNMDLSRLAYIKKENLARKDKYIKALKYLTDESKSPYQSEESII